MNQNTDHTLGYLAFLLHAHLPFVRNTAQEFCLEEKWFFEGLTESYLPLLLSWEALAKRKVNFGLALSLSPTLISMLRDEQLVGRYRRYLALHKELALRETERTARDPDFREISRFYYQRLELIEQAFNSYRGDLLAPLQKLAKQGYLELLTTCATHGYLPLMLTEESRRAQIRTGVALFTEAIGWAPQGIWLPECGYAPGIERLLHAEGIEYFIMSGHGFTSSCPPPPHWVYVPVKTGNIAVFGRDYETSQQVWSRTEGYPGDYNYREFYRDIGYDLDYDYLAPYLVAGIRSDTGLKYYRITGKTEQKKPYNVTNAQLKAAEHARDFLDNRHRQLEHWAAQMNVKPIITAPYDAELFGHWWFEGPDWLAKVLELAAKPESKVRCITFSKYLERFPPQQQVTFAHSSWGEGGYNRYWLNPSNDWLYPYYHRAEKVMRRLAVTYQQPSPLQKRALNQAARELMLAQSSDWPFILTSGTVVDYARQRLHQHLTNFFKISRGLRNQCLKESELRRLEESDQIFPRIDYRIYQPNQSTFCQALQSLKPGKPVILMLSWEFPPRHVGGLGIHVRDLSIELVRLGWNVQVLTVPHKGAAGFDLVQGVGVHYIPTYQPLAEQGDFMAWMLQFNLAIADYGRELVSYLKNPVVVHAHDWLVAYAARELQTMARAPLITTIHATEHGRNNGIHTTMQHAIHQIETELVHSSQQVICCSQYMYGEIQNLFGLTAPHLQIIANGVKLIQLPQRDSTGRTILYVGRLVIEKGVQHLLQALPGLTRLFSDLKLVIAGDGPYRQELQDLAYRLGVEDQVIFTGFVSEDRRNQLLSECRVAVFPSLYEPFGIVALEAMVAGVPVVVARTGGLMETVKPEITGLWFNPGDINDLQRCLIRVLQNPQWAGELSRRAQTVAGKDYTWERVARKTSAVYQKELMKIRRRQQAN